MAKQVIGIGTTANDGTGDAARTAFGKVNDNFTENYDAIERQQAKGTNIASATTTDIGAATGDFVHVTGTTTITGLGTITAGRKRIVRFAGILTLTHNATSLILPTGASIITAADDVATFVSEGSGNWRCVEYTRANGTALLGVTPTELNTKEDIVTIAIAGGTANAITIPNTLPAAYTSNESFLLKVTTTNTGSVTINRNSLGAKTLKKYGTTDVIAGDLVAGCFYEIAYDGTNYQIVGSNVLAQNIPTRTGSVIAFDTSAIYNTLASPATGNVTFDLTGAIANTEVVLYHNGASPTFPAIATVIGNYYASNNNEIRLIYRSGSEVDVVIRNSNSSGYTNPTSYLFPDLPDVGGVNKATTTATSAITVTGLEKTLLAGKTYKILGQIQIGCNNTGGVKLKANFSSTTNLKCYISLFGRTTGNTVLQFAGITPSSSGFNTVTSSAFNTLNNENGTIEFKGTIFVGDNNSNFSIGVASTTSGQTTTVYEIGSFLEVTLLD